MAGEDDLYETHWDPTTLSDAMKLIVVNDDEEFFASTGKDVAEAIVPLLGGDDLAVLDLGCGIGRVAQYVAPRCKVLYAVDISERMLELARERLASHGNVQYLRSAPSSIPGVEDGGIDFLYSVLVLQHVEREDAFLMLRDIRRVVRDGGVAYLTFPNLLHDGYLASFVYYAESGEVSNKARARFYTPSEVERLVLAAGFSEIDLTEGPDIVAVCR
jgi:ubiquinone/menaquinone biosynthesis C-methylase UbiE